MLKELSENLNNIKRIQSEMKDTVTEMKNNWQGIHSTVDETENENSDLEYKEAKNTQSEQQKEKKNLKIEYSVRSLCDNFKSTNICIMRVQEGEEREQKVWNLFEKITTENFPNLVKEIDIQQEAQRVPNKMKPKRPPLRHIILN